MTIRQSRLKDRLCLIQRYGSFPLAYATLQSTLSHFDDDDGYIAYQPSSTGPLVLSEPVVDPSKRNRLIDSFLEKYPTATFFHLGSDLMTYLERLGHKTHRMGYEHILELDTFEGSWSSHRSLRSGFNKGIKQVSVSETTLSNLNPADLGRVLKDWLATKAQRRQNGFLCRPVFCRLARGDTGWDLTIYATVPARHHSLVLCRFFSGITSIFRGKRRFVHACHSNI